MSELLEHASHPPLPLPNRPYVGRMRWHDLLFAHWPADPEDVRHAMPEPLRPYLDLFDGRAWIGVIPFWMSHVGPRFLPALPGLSTMPEINVRTYVTVDGRPGVFFFSLDTTHVSAVFGARLMYSLPYFHARMAAIGESHIGDRVEELKTNVDGAIHYFSERLVPPLPAGFRATYRPIGPPFNAQPGSIEYFFVERYCLYTTRRSQIIRADIHHLPWPLQPAVADIQLNTMAPTDGLVLPRERPLLHFAKRLDVLVWWPQRVSP